MTNKIFSSDRPHPSDTLTPQDGGARTAPCLCQAREKWLQWNC